MYTITYALTALTAEQLVREAMAVLVEKTRVVQSFHRDFDSKVSEYGEIVNYNAPVDGVAKRCVEGNPYVFQTPAATGGSVKLNQELYAAFSATERQLTRSFADLRQYFLIPYLRPVVQKLEKIGIGEIYNTLQSGGGHVSGKIGTALTYATMNHAKAQLNRRNVDMEGRPLYVGPDAESQITNIAQFTEQQMSGDGSPLLNGYVGRGAGFNVALANAMPEINATDSRTGAINLGAGYAAGTTVMAVDGFTGAGVTGQWCTIDGVPYRLTGHDEAVADLTEITIAAPGLRDAVANDAVVKVYDGGTVNEAAGYAIGYEGEITYANFTIDPQVGQGLCFAAATPIYSVVSVDTTAKTVLLNRPLDLAVSNGDVIHLTPEGKYSWCFTGPSQILVVRPMEMPTEMGVLAAQVDYEGFALRLMMSYDHTYRKYLVSLNMLCGVATYNPDFNHIIVN